MRPTLLISSPALGALAALLLAGCEPRLSSPVMTAAEGAQGRGRDQQGRPHGEGSGSDGDDFDA